ncbi:MAG: hypothetical protein TH68_02855, partial [Candidatus Synechococcus spongiarum 142]
MADSTDEANGAVTVVVAEDGDSYVVGSSSSAQVTVNDGPTLSLSLAASGDEGNSSYYEVDVTISLSPTRSEATTFDFCVKNTGTALFRMDSNGQARDFDIVNYFSGTQLLMPQNCHNYTINGNEGRSAVKLRIFGDTTPELSETVILELRNPPNGVAVSSTAGTATYTINNDDGTPSVLSLGLTPASGNEGDSGNSDVNVTISLSPTLPVATAFNFCVKNTGTATFRMASDGTAQDFDIVNFFGAGSPLQMNDQNCHNYTIPGNTGSSQVKLRIFGDTVPEFNETVILELRNPPSDVAVSPTAGTATYTINTDDGTPSILSISGTAIDSERSGGGGFRHLIFQRLSRSRSTDTTFFLCLKNTSTATFRRASGGKARDFDISSFGDLKINGQPCGRYTIPAGSRIMSFGMTVDKDNTRELDETVILELRNPPEGVAVSSTAGTFTHTIVNDDGAPRTITITGGTAVTEGTGAQFTVNASPAPSAKL